MTNRKWLVRVGVMLGLVLAGSVVADLMHGRIVTVHNFSGTDLSGKRWTLADYRGHQPVIVDFFATWCGPCRMELPHLVELQKKYAERGLKVVAVTDESRDTVLADPELRTMPLTILTNEGPVLQDYGISSIPRTIVFRADGTEVADIEGFDQEALQDAERNLL